MSNRLKENKMKKFPLWVFGPAATAVAIGVVMEPAVAHSERIWDVGEFDSCVTILDSRYELGDIDYWEWSGGIETCCYESGGDWNSAAQKCEAPPATAQTAPQSPGEIVQAPSAGTAAPPQNPERTGGGTFEAVPIGPGGGPVLYMP
ncbi:hypothetical protein ABQF17_00875 [Mycolicibacterium elephantis]